MKLLLIPMAAMSFSGVLSAEPPPKAAPSGQPPYAEFYNPAKGFTPASADLTADFLQLAGSLEATGSPEPYIRHVLAECARIDAKYQKATGKAVSSKPAYLTDDYVENLLAGWNKLEAPLKLEALSRESGRNMRYAILGSWNKSIAEKVAEETKLDPEEARTYRQLLEKPYFKKADFSAMDSFYKGPHEKLTDDGKQELSRRVWLGTQDAEERTKILNQTKGGTALVGMFTTHQAALVAHLEGRSDKAANADTLEASLIAGLKLDEESGDWSKLPAHDGDPLIYSHAIRTGFQLRIQAAKKQTDADNAGKIEIALKSMPENLIVLANSEFLAALREGIADRKNSTVPK